MTINHPCVYDSKAWFTPINDQQLFLNKNEDLSLGRHMVTAPSSSHNPLTPPYLPSPYHECQPGRRHSQLPAAQRFLQLDQPLMVVLLSYYDHLYLDPILALLRHSGMI